MRLSPRTCGEQPMKPSFGARCRGAEVKPMQASGRPRRPCINSCINGNAKNGWWRTEWGLTRTTSASSKIDKPKRQIGRWLLPATATTRCLKPILEEIALNLQKLVRNRSQPRRPQPKRHLSHAYERLCLYANL